jgi:hypothetical protein
MTAQSISNEIILKIKKIYDIYEEEANLLTAEKRKDSGAQIDKQEKPFLEKLAKLQVTV